MDAIKGSRELFWNVSSAYWLQRALDRLCRPTWRTSFKGAILQQREGPKCSALFRGTGEDSVGRSGSVFQGFISNSYFWPWKSASYNIGRQRLGRGKRTPDIFQDGIPPASAIQGWWRSHFTTALSRAWTAQSPYGKLESKACMTICLCRQLWLQGPRCAWVGNFCSQRHRRDSCPHGIYHEAAQRARGGGASCLISTLFLTMPATYQFSSFPGYEADAPFSS